MKKLMNELVRFEELGKIRDAANLNGDYKSGNRAYHDMEKIYRIAAGDSDRDKFYLAILESAVSPSALITCCAHMMRMDIHAELARKQLEEMVNDLTYHPLVRFNAKIFLSEWDQGHIKR